MEKRSKQVVSKSKDSHVLAEPEMDTSKTGFLVTVEDLINLAFGPHDINQINFKMIQMIINMLANQLRLLDKKVQLNTETVTNHEAAATAEEEEAISGKSARQKTSGIKGKDDVGTSVHGGKSETAAEIKAKAKKTAGKKTTGTKRKDDVGTSKSEDINSEDDDSKLGGKLESKESITDTRKGIQTEGSEVKKSTQTMDTKGTAARLKKSKTKVKKIHQSNWCQIKGFDELKKDVEGRLALYTRKSPSTTTKKKRESGIRAIGGIEVVPMSRFKELEEIIKDLKKKVTAPSVPKLPDNKKLLDDLEKGTASLTDTMTALSLVARVQAAESAIDHLSGMITKLASETTLDEKAEPEKVESKVEPLEEKPGKVKKLYKETRKYQEDGKEKEVVVYVKEHETSKEAGLSGAGQASTHRHQIQSIKSKKSQLCQSLYGLSMDELQADRVTHEEMDEKIRELGDQLLGKLNNITGYATSAAEKALVMVTDLTKKLEIALCLDDRITLVTNILSSYVQEMRGIDSSKDVQMLNFQEQLNQMANELRGAMSLLAKYDKNAQNSAITELTESYELLVQELEETIERHKKTVHNQDQLGLEIQILVESIEALRAQKADRDEVVDGLKDKVNISRLRGLLKEEVFVAEHLRLESRLLHCQEKFRRQEETWLLVIKDFEELIKLKADIQHVFEAKETMQAGLQDVYSKLQLLARVLGDPKAAVVTRKMEMSSSCGACNTPVRLDAGDHSSELKVKLPALDKKKPELTQAEMDQQALWELIDAPKDRKHVCHRWTGGSHTVVPPFVFQRGPPPRRFTSAPPMKSYITMGDDGKPYRCSRRLEPCFCDDDDPVKAP